MRILLHFSAFWLLAAPLLANPANKRALEKHFGEFFPKKLDSCAVCHVGDSAHGAETLGEFPHNPFGDRLRQLGHDRNFGERLDEIANDDTDGDGVSNFDEILASSFPGDPEKTAKPAESQVTGFAEFQNRYRWRPFEPVTRPAVPEVGNSKSEIRNPIDAFVAAAREKRDLTAQPEASREIWLRRVYLDLIGLAPTPEQLQAFLTDQQPGAHERVVNELLENPAYGERWGRHWMDIWRYSDWAGYKDALRDSQRHIWHWRDWIVEALNEDKPYDRMIHEMLAGDEIAPEDPATVRATGFLARNYFRERDQWMDNVVTHTSQAFLGLTMGCVKCHDHKYDPISHREYYAMRAIFEPYNVRTDRVPGELDIMQNGIPRVYDQSTASKTYLFERGDERFPVKDEPIPPAPPKALGGSYEVKTVSLPEPAYQPEQRSFVKQDLVQQAQDKVDAAKDDLQRKAAQLQLDALQAVLKIEEMNKESPEWEKAAKGLVQLQRQAALADADWKVEAANRIKDEKKKAKDLAAAKKALAAAKKEMAAEVTTKYKPRDQKTYPPESSGRRLAFAKWLTTKENPLTARVAMNHIWLRHFGQPIVPTVADFGGNGREPTHPALLDWLAAEFMASDWSMKEMHRLICTSATYRLAGTTDEANAAIDPDNRYLWRMPARRMEGEIVRDNLLHIAGTLDPTFGGPDIDHTKAQTSKRRSIYLRHAHEKLVEFVQIFDGPKVTECYMRDESVQPHQALALANSPLTFDQSKALTQELATKTQTDDEFIEQAFLHILNRHPITDEIEACREFLNKNDNPQRARENLVMVLFNHNEFVTIR